MLERDEKILREKMQPVADDVGRLFIDSMCLRVRYHLVIAEENGAEAEDAPKIIANAIDTGAEAMREALEIISERKNAQAWNKARDKNQKT